MHTPQNSYRIWFTQRSGSTLLCKALAQTGIAGNPGEYFTLMDAEDSLAKKFSAHDYASLKQNLWKAGSTDNGIFGLKVPLHYSRYQKVLAEIRAFRNLQTEDDEALLAELFPNCRHIYLSRRNKIRQVVSWWKAIQDHVWHMEGNQSRTQKADFYADKYNPDALRHLFQESVLMECAKQDYFARYGIKPLSIIYEDFVADYENSIRRILDYLELDHQNLRIQPPFYQKTADDISEEWVARFKKDLQQNFSEIVY
ncbi:MAG: Stf0 family sulfotransferase [Bacteroidota bacterium]